MSRFKAGDLAIVIKCNDAPELVGKCVELVEFVKFGCTPFSDQGWNPFDCDAWLVTGEGLLAMNGHGLVPAKFTAFPEGLLMPLRGDFTPEEMREMEKEHA